MTRALGRAPGGAVRRQAPPRVIFATCSKNESGPFACEPSCIVEVSEDSFALVFDAGGTMLRVATVPKLQPASYTVLGCTVPHIREAVHGLEVRGVRFRRYDGLRQDEHGIWTAPRGAKVEWFADPDGNTLSLTEFHEAGAVRE